MIEATVAIERWELRELFATSRDAITHIAVVVATLTDRDGRRGRGEAAGVDYDGETPESMRAQIEHVAGELDTALTGRDLAALLPCGGARNALDCALWDLRAKQSGIPAWRSAGLAALAPVETCLTLGLDDEATQGARGARLPAAQAQARRRAPPRRRPRRARGAPARAADRRCEPGLGPRAARAAAAAARRGRRRADRAAGAAARGRLARRPRRRDPARRRRVLRRPALAARARRPLPLPQHQARQVRRADRGAGAARRGAQARLRAHGRQHVRHLARDGAGLPDRAVVPLRRPRRAAAAAARPRAADPLHGRAHGPAAGGALGLRTLSGARSGRSR